MGITRIDAQDLRAIFEFVAYRIEQEESALNALDAAIGDGDHGITMRTGFQAVKDTITVMPVDASPTEVLNEAGEAFMSAAGGAIGVILGSMFIAGGKALVNSTQIGAAEVKTLLYAMEAGVVNAGKAHPGDKTLLDPLHAACESLASATTDDLGDAFSRAAAAANASAQSTAKMLCRLGRASRLGDRVLGHPDPGAVSFSLIMRSIAEWVLTKGAVSMPSISRHSLV
jgi:dihydroxyacetone kinase phosphoprotein-dependent L subunit